MIVRVTEIAYFPARFQVLLGGGDRTWLPPSSSNESPTINCLICESRYPIIVRETAGTEWTITRESGLLISSCGKACTYTSNPYEEKEWVLDEISSILLPGHEPWEWPECSCCCLSEMIAQVNRLNLGLRVIRDNSGHILLINDHPVAPCYKSDKLNEFLGGFPVVSEEV